MDRNEAIARGVVELDKCFNKADRDAVFGRLYDAGHAAATTWTPASEKPTHFNDVAVIDVHGNHGNGWSGISTWYSTCPGEVIAWMEWPPFVPEKA